MEGNETRLNWRIFSPCPTSPKQRSGDRRPCRHSPASWHAAIFNGIPEIPPGSSSPPSPNAILRRRCSSSRIDDAERRNRRKSKASHGVFLRRDQVPVPSIKCACCCLPDFTLYCTGCQSRNVHPPVNNTQPAQEPQPFANTNTNTSSPPTPAAPPRLSCVIPQPDPTEIVDKTEPIPPPVNPPHAEEEPCPCPCLHFLGGSPYFPAPEPNTWQFVYWPRLNRKCKLATAPINQSTRPSVTFNQKPENQRRTSKQTNSSKTSSNASTQIRLNLHQPKYPTEEGARFCKGGWRCQCSKYELPEASVLAPIPPTSAPHIETTVLVPTSTKIVVPAAVPGMSGRLFRVCMPPSELPMCHCPLDCPCPHPRCPIDIGKCSQGDTCDDIVHLPKNQNESLSERPSVLFGRDPLLKNV